MATRLLERRGAFALATLACLLVAALLRPFPDRFKFRDGGDCVRYRDWSHAVRDQGPAAFPKLVDEYRHRWIGFPPPTRFAWLGAAALVERAWPHPADEYDPLVLLAWLPGVLALIPLGLWLRRLGPPEVAVGAMLLLATAPVPRALSHWPLPDSALLAVGLWLVALVSAELRAPARWRLAAIALVAALAIALRETGLLNVLAAAALVVVDRRRTGRLARAPLFALLGGCLLVTLITIPIAGGPKELAGLVADVVRGSLKLTGNMGYVSGPYYRYFVDFTLVSPALVALVLVALVPLARRPDARPLLAEVSVAAIAPIAVFALLPKTLRYVMIGDAGLRAIAACACYALWTSGRRRLAPILFVVLVAHDLAIYFPLWGREQFYDPVTWCLVKGLRMIP